MNSALTASASEMKSAPKYDLSKPCVEHYVQERTSGDGLLPRDMWVGNEYEQGNSKARPFQRKFGSSWKNNQSCSWRGRKPDQNRYSQQYVNDNAGFGFPVGSWRSHNSARVNSNFYNQKNSTVNGSEDLCWRVKKTEIHLTGPEEENAHEEPVKSMSIAQQHEAAFRLYQASLSTMTEIGGNDDLSIASTISTGSTESTRTAVSISSGDAKYHESSLWSRQSTDDRDLDGDAWVTADKIGEKCSESSFESGEERSVESYSRPNLDGDMGLSGRERRRLSWYLRFRSQPLVGPDDLVEIMPSWMAWRNFHVTRSGILPFVIDPNDGSCTVIFGRDDSTDDLTDFGGGRRARETAGDTATRKLKYEGRGCFDTRSLRCGFALVTRKETLFFVPVSGTVLEYIENFKSCPALTRAERNVSGLVGVHESMLSSLAKHPCVVTIGPRAETPNPTISLKLFDLIKAVIEQVAFQDKEWFKRGLEFTTLD